MDKALVQALQIAGGRAKLAAALGCTRQTIYTWNSVPPGRVLAVSRATGIPRSVLRPDIYPPEEEYAPRLQPAAAE